MNCVCNYQVRQAIFLETHNIVKPPICSACNQECILYQLESIREQNRNRFPFRWECTNSDCGSSHTHSFLHNSYLKNAKLSAFKHIQLLYKFYGKRNAVQAASETKIHVDTVRRWFDYYRRCISHYIQHHYYPHFMFSIDYAIEYDEAAISAKHMHHRGRYREPIWVLGGHVESCCKQEPRHFTSFDTGSMSNGFNCDN